MKMDSRVFFWSIPVVFVILIRDIYSTPSASLRRPVTCVKVVPVKEMKLIESKFTITHVPY